LTISWPKEYGGMVLDLDNASQAFTIEASRHFTDRIKAILETAFFVNSDRKDIAYDFRDDDFIRLELAYYF